MIAEDELTDLERQQVKLMQLYQLRKRQRRLFDYAPYPKQLDFHAAGRTFRERLFRAGNQLGKTLSAAAETAFHLTGRYPDWWPGRRFNRATKGWVVSEDMKFSRDNAQRLLLGEPGEWGTGYIPAEYIVKITVARHSVPDAVDTVLVRHTSGRISKLMFKSAEVPRNKLGGDTLDWAWCDEELPYDHYEEVLTRTNVTQGPVYTTFTPLKGQTPLVKRFLIDKAAGTADVVMTIYDALHYTPEQRDAIIASYPPHTRQARTMGTPTLGEGLIFTQDESVYKCRVMKEIPAHWPQIVGLDFGITHPFAMARFAIDRDTDTAYLTHGYRKSGETPAQHYVPYRDWGGWFRTAWPADALQTEKGTGEQLALQCRKAGFKMLKEKAMLPKSDSSTENLKSRLSVEAGLFAISEAMDAGRFKVFETVEPFFDEIRLYHRQDGKVVKKNDDFMSASRYGYVMRRFATLKPSPESSSVLPISYSDRT